MIVIHRNASILLFLHAMLLLAAGCSSTPPAPETIEPPPVVYFTDAELRAMMLPQHMPPSQPQNRPGPTPEPRYYVHTIANPGETLIAIARWYTGDGENWKRLAKINQELDPRRMGIGGTVLIPEEMLRTRNPMPKSVSPPRPAPKTSLSSAPPSKVVAPPPLFGPIESTPSSTPEGKTPPSPPLQPLDE